MSSMINVFLTITAWMKTKQGCFISAVNFMVWMNSELHVVLSGFTV